MGNNSLSNEYNMIYLFILYNSLGGITKRKLHQSDALKWENYWTMYYQLYKYY